jgi:glycosyltransferase involved in cell wall biosynthesis
MPLADDEWARGKCGNKAIYYMASEIPTVLSPVGVNASLVQNGTTGFAASTHDEWFERLAQLVESRDLRQTLGRNARVFVLNQYSREVAVDRFSNLVHSTLQNQLNGN